MSHYERYEPEHHYGKDYRKMTEQEILALSFKERFGIALNRIRLTNEVSQKELAEAVGVDRATISNYESGKRLPDFEICCKIAKAFGVTLDYFYCLDDCPPSQDRYAYFSPKVKEVITVLLSEPHHKKTMELMLMSFDILKMMNMIYSYCTYSSKIDAAHKAAMTEEDKTNILKEQFSEYYLPYDNIGKKNTCELFRCAAHMFLDRIIEDIKKDEYYKEEMHKKIDEFISERDK